MVPDGWDDTWDASGRRLSILDHAAARRAAPSFRADRTRDHVPSGKHAKAQANLRALDVLAELNDEVRHATEDEQRTLAAWSGWGALPEMFERTPRPEWKALADGLRRRLTDREWHDARASTPNAHYTSTTVAAAMWDAVVALGFDGGRVLEPGCGSGNFFGLAPENLELELTGIETDPTSARVCQRLYPQARVIGTRFETIHLPAGFDLVIGNVPFANVTPFDPKYNAESWSLHNYFIAKSVALTRPGGLVALITSRYTLDARSTRFRRWLADRAELLGAVRLPGTAFRSVAGTNAITDILLLGPKEVSPARSSRDWLETTRVVDDRDDTDVWVNEWFIADPAARVCGSLAIGRGQHRDQDLVVEPPADLDANLAGALARIVAEHPTAPGRRTPIEMQTPPAEPVHTHGSSDLDLGPGSLVALADGAFGRVEPGGVEVVSVPNTQRDELIGLIGLRDTTMRLLAAEAADDEHDAVALRAELNRRYDGHVAAVGPVNRCKRSTHDRLDPSTGEPVVTRRFPPMGGFRLDPGWALVSALERYDEDTGVASKANIFTERVIKPRPLATTAATPAEALAIALDRSGRVDLPLISDLLGVENEDAREQLGGLVFEDPTTSTLIPADEYLSGDVRTKLDAARAAHDDDPSGRFRRNVDELRRALPADLGPGEIDAALGAPWIAAGDVAGFVREVFGARTAEVFHDPVITSWEIGTPTWQRSTVEMTSTWGTARRNAVDLTEAALNQRPVTVYDTRADGSRVVNDVETMAARDKLEQIQERFGTWIWEDAKRAERLCAEFNRRFNSIVLRRFDGSHLELPGLADWFRPHAHQRDAVWRILSEGDVLLAHVVGAGKTATMVMAAMEMRRLGLVTKPCFVVPNHMLEQFTREFLQLYPQARVLATNLGGTNLDRRRQFVARCATGDWDGIILPRESFRLLPVARGVEQGYLEQRIEELDEALESARAKRPTVKELEKALARERARLEKLLNTAARDDSVLFEQTGIDYLFVDEAHGYKGKRIWSRIPDVSGAESQRATDLDMKLQWLRQRHAGRVATFATGTPIANAISEMWVMQSYLQPDLLAHAGCEHFDAWAGTFASTVTSLELKPSGGGYQQKTRFARYRNVPELLRLFHANADVRAAADLALPTPAVKGGGETIAVPASPALVAYVDTLVARAERVSQRAVDPAEDNMLKITGDGRKAALDLRLVGVSSADGDDSHGKVRACAARVASIWGAHRDVVYTDGPGGERARPGALQIVFCDLGTPKGDGSWSVYDDLRGELIRRGLPPDGVRFVHEAANDRQKAELFQQCRDGRVAVIVGSSEKMGVGTNTQTRAVAVHHLDCPWRPAELEQREGRILRQGNQNPEVQILRYVTEGSFDVFMWQTVTRKAKFINQVMTSDPASVAREIDDLGEQALTYGQVMAIATGNPLIMERAAVEADISKLRRLRSAHEAEQRLLTRRVKSWGSALARLADEVAALEAAESMRTPTTAERFQIVQPDGSVVTSRSEWGAWLRTTIVTEASPHLRSVREIDAGRLGGLDVRLLLGDDRAEGGAVVEIMQAGKAICIDRHEAVAADPIGLVRRVENLLERIPAWLEDASNEHARLTGELGVAEGRVGLPFPGAGELRTCEQRLSQIEATLAPSLEPSPVANVGPAVRPEPTVSQGVGR